MKDDVCCGLQREVSLVGGLVPAVGVSRTLWQEPRHTALPFHGFLQPTLQPGKVEVVVAPAGG